MSLVIKKFGAIAFLIGLVGFALALVLGANLDYSTQELVGWVVIGMTAAIVYFGIAYQRDTVNAGKITFGQALKTGIVIAALGGLGIALVDVLYTLFVNPDFFEEYNTYMRDLHRDTPQMDKVFADLDKQDAFREEYGLGVMSLFAGLMMFVMTFVLGCVVSFVSALILKKE